MTERREHDRLAMLERSGLTHHDRAYRLNHLCYSAVELLNTDVAQINALTSTEQVYVAEWPRVKRDPIPIETSGCSLLFETRDTMAVEDTRRHPVLCQLPWTANWQGYLGTPLTYQGEIIGSMCVLTINRRRWTPMDKATLEGLAELAVASLDH